MLRCYWLIRYENTQDKEEHALEESINQWLLTEDPSNQKALKPVSTDWQYLNTDNMSKLIQSGSFDFISIHPHNLADDQFKDDRAIVRNQSFAHVLLHCQVNAEDVQIIRYRYENQPFVALDININWPENLTWYLKNEKRYFDTNLIEKIQTDHAEYLRINSSEYKFEKAKQLLHKPFANLEEKNKNAKAAYAILVQIKEGAKFHKQASELLGDIYFDEACSKSELALSYFENAALYYGRAKNAEKSLLVSMRLVALSKDLITANQAQRKEIAELRDLANGYHNQLAMVAAQTQAQAQRTSPQPQRTPPQIQRTSPLYSPQLPNLAYYPQPSYHHQPGLQVHQPVLLGQWMTMYPQPQQANRHQTPLYPLYEHQIPPQPQQLTPPSPNPQFSG